MSSSAQAASHVFQLFVLKFLKSEPGRLILSSARRSRLETVPARPLNSRLDPCIGLATGLTATGSPAHERRRRVEISVVVARQVGSIDSEGRPRKYRQHNRDEISAHGKPPKLQFPFWLPVTGQYTAVCLPSTKSAAIPTFKCRCCALRRMPASRKVSNFCLAGTFAWRLQLVPLLLLAR